MNGPLTYPDSPSGTFLHWLVTGIDPGTTRIDEGQVPPGGREWPNSFGEIGWSGPQPPPGDSPHRYVFQLYALAQPIRPAAHPDIGQLRRQLDEPTLASGSTVGLYQR